MNHLSLTILLISMSENPLFFLDEVSILLHPLRFTRLSALQTTLV